MSTDRMNRVTEDKYTLVFSEGDVAATVRLMQTPDGRPPIIRVELPAGAYPRITWVSGQRSEAAVDIELTTDQP